MTTLLEKLCSLLKGKTAVDLYRSGLVITNYCGHGIDALNKKVIDDMAINTTFAQLNKKTPRCDAVVNLTSFPARINEVHYTLLSLLFQSLLPKRIVLWLSREEFPLGTNELPDSLVCLEDYGVSIAWTQNLKSYNKLVPALLNGRDTINVTADDDIFYHRDWLKELYAEYVQHGDGFVYAHRAHRIQLNRLGVAPYCNWDREIPQGAPTFLNVATGVGGVMYPPNSLAPQATDSNAFMEASPSNDDLWFWAMGVLNNSMTRVTKDRRKLVYINPERELRMSGEFTLAQENVIKGANDLQMQKILESYPEILENLSD